MELHTKQTEKSSNLLMTVIFDFITSPVSIPPLAVHVYVPASASVMSITLNKTSVVTPGAGMNFCSLNDTDIDDDENKMVK